MANSEYIGNGIGMLYVVDPTGTTIVASQPNTPKGVRDIRAIGTVCSPISAVRSAVGTITFTATPAGNVTAITIGGVNQISGNVAMIAGDTTLSALAVASAINLFTPPSGDDFTAAAIGNIVYIFSTPSGGSAANGLAITVSVSTVSITSTTVPFSSGSNQTGVFDSVIGLRFYLNERGNAPRNNFASATEITKYIVLRGLQTGIVTKSLAINNDKLTGIDRSCAITNIFVDTQSSAATDELSFIETVDFVEGDVIRLSQFIAGRVVVVTDQSVSLLSGNIYLTDQTPFNCQDNKSIELRLQFATGLGLIWVENGRSISGGAEQLSRIEMLAKIAAGTVVQGQSYFITNVGQAGIIVTGIDSTSITSRGDYIGYFPDYQNVSGDYQWMWSPIMIAPTVAKLYATGGFMYESVTGAIGTNPTTDTTNWTLIPITDPRYQKVILNVQYDIDSNLVLQGSDGYGNIVNGSTAFQTFKWGSNTCFENIINTSNLNVNSINGFFGGNIMNNCSMPITSAVYIDNLTYNNLNNLDITIFSSGGGVTIRKNIGSLTGLDLSTTTNNISIDGCLFTCGEKRIGIAGNGYTVRDCTFGGWNGVTSSIYEFGTFSLRNSQIAWPYLNLDQNELQLIVNAEVSNHVRTIDLDGSSWVLNRLSIPSTHTSCSIIRLTAATTKTINKIYDASGATRPLTLTPVNGVNVIIQRTAIGSAVAENIVGAAAGNTTLVGRTNGSDFYQVTKTGTFFSSLHILVHG